MRRAVALGVAEGDLGDHLGQASLEVGHDVRVRVLVDGDAGGGVGDEDEAEPLPEPPFPDGVPDEMGEIDELGLAFGLDGVFVPHRVLITS